MLIARFVDRDGGTVIGAGPSAGELVDLTRHHGVATVARAASLAGTGELDAMVAAGPSIRVARLLPPIDGDARILCVGYNFATTGAPAPESPTIFVRFPSSLVGPDEVVVHPGISEQFDWEGEVAAVVGRGGRAIAPRAAVDHIAGFTCIAENSVRDFQRHGTQATAGKNFDRSGAIGPWIVTVDALPPIAQMELETHLNGERVQHGCLADLVFGVDHLVSYISSFMALRPGDVLALGTPPGIGARRQPPRWLVEADRLDVTVTGIGCLSNTVAAAVPVATY